MVGNGHQHFNLRHVILIWSKLCLLCLSNASVKSISSRWIYLCMYVVRAVLKWLVLSLKPISGFLSNKLLLYFRKPHSVLLPKKWHVSSSKSCLIWLYTAEFHEAFIRHSYIRTESLDCVSPKDRLFCFCPKVKLVNVDQDY